MAVPLSAAMYTLEKSHLDLKAEGSQSFAIDHIVNKAPMPFEIAEEENGEIRNIFSAENSPVDLTKAYNDWFNNLNDRIIEQGRQEEFKFMQDIIDFGMSKDLLYPADSETVGINNGVGVYILEDEDPYWRNNAPTANGTFDKSIFYMRIYLLKQEQKYLQFVLTHEVGHSLAIADSYIDTPQLENILYGSDPRSTIMDSSNTLTCDDADALANAIFITMRNKDKIPQSMGNSFRFQSFCTPKDEERVSFQDGKQLNRKPVFAFSNGNYYLTEFCKNGEIKKTTEIYFIKPENPLKTTINSDCEALEYKQESPSFKQNPALSYKFVDLSSAEQREKIPADKNTVVYEYAPNIVREITFDNEVSKTMVKIKNFKGQLLYVYAILDEEKAFMYSITDHLMLVYDTRDFNKYTAIQGSIKSTPKGSANLITVEQLEKLRNFINKDRAWMRGTFESRKTVGNHLIEATRWQGYLQKYYPHKDFKTKAIKISKKDLERFGKGLNKNFF